MDTETSTEMGENTPIRLQPNPLSSELTKSPYVDLKSIEALQTCFKMLLLLKTVNIYIYISLCLEK